MRRKKRRALAGAIDPLMGRMFMAFNTPDDKGGGGGGSDPEPKPEPKDDLIPRSEAQAAFKDRDKAKAGVKLFATALGIDPDEVEIIATGDKENPYKLSAPGLDELAQSIADAKKAKRAATKWEDREAELVAKHQKQIEKVNAAHSNAIKARDQWIAKQAVADEIRRAAAEEHVLPEAVDDVIGLVTPRVRLEITVDDEASTLAVKTTPLDESGDALIDEKTAKPVTIRALVKSFLDKRPHLREARFRSGPGAGGNAVPGEKVKTKTEKKSGNSAAFMFGR